MILQSTKRKKNYPKKFPFKIPIIPSILAVFLALNILFTGFIVSQLNLVEVFFALTSKGSFNGVNILAFGVDDTHSSTRADSIMVFHLDDSLSHLGVLSIPRDTRVPIDGRGLSRINHSFSYGGRPLLTKTVSDFLNIPLHHYIKVNLNGISTLVDEMGGITINVEKDMNYIDQAGDLYIDLKQGKQQLSGDQVVQYLRFRHDDEGDIGRIRRQQKFIYTLANQFVKPENIFDLHKLIKGINAVLDTDLTTKEMVKLSSHFKNAYKKGAIKKETLPGKVALIGNAYYWEPNHEKIDDTLASLFDRSTPLDKLVALNEQVNNSNDNMIKEVETTSAKNQAALAAPKNIKKVSPKPKIVELTQQENNDLDLKPISLSAEIEAQKALNNKQETEQLSHTLDNAYTAASLEEQLKFKNLAKEELVPNVDIAQNNTYEKVETENLDRWAFFDNDKEDEPITNKKVQKQVAVLADNIKALETVKTNKVSETKAAAKVADKKPVAVPDTIALNSKKEGKDNQAITKVTNLSKNSVTKSTVSQLNNSTDTIVTAVKQPSLKDNLLKLKESITQTLSEKPEQETEPTVTIAMKKDVSNINNSINKASLIAEKLAANNVSKWDVQLAGIVEVLNGYGTPKEAQFAARLLKTTGVSISRYADAGNYNYEKTVLVDWKGNMGLAKDVTRFLEIDPENIIVYDRPNKSIDFTLVLGKDWPKIKEMIQNR